MAFMAAKCADASSWTWSAYSACEYEEADLAPGLEGRDQGWKMEEWLGC
jgi:hypothetical protein